MNAAPVRLVLMLLLVLPLAEPSAQSVVPIREMGAVEATSTEPFLSILNVRAVRSGKLLVNDGVRRQVVILDDHLGLEQVLLDSTSTAGRNYGPRASTLIAYLGDSTLFVDVVASTLLVLDPNGKVARVMAPPKARDVWMFAGASSTIDQQGNLIYRGALTISSNRTPVPGEKPALVHSPDSAPLLRANFETRSVDTLGKVRVQSPVSTSSVQLGNGMIQVTKFINPVVTVDEWAVLSDGSVAFVRGRDYHIDWLSSNGQRRSSEKLPFDWKALSGDDKLALMDSARKAEEKALAASKLAARERASIQGDPAMRVAPSLDPTIEFVPLTEMSDYVPAIRYGAAKADLDGQLWILPTTSAQSKAGELVYDVVNNRGQLTHRVRVPANRSIAGFGHNGVVYLMFRDDAGIWHLERTRVRTTTKS